MEIIAAEDIGNGIDLFPPLAPLTFSLYDSYLTSHCSSCFSILSQPPPQTLPQPPITLYCSAVCSLSDSPIVFPPEIFPLLPSDIRAALRLLNSISSSAEATAFLPHRLGGLLTNHHRLMADSSFSLAIHRAVTFMTANCPLRKDTGLEEAAICCVLTNAVEVQDSTGRGLGIALYDSRFSWINHCCSPNACYRFLISPFDSITTTSNQNCPKTLPRINNTEKEQVALSSITSHWKGKTVGCGPKVTVRSIKRIKSGEEITVSYIDLLQPTGLRLSELWVKYRFMCSCVRCAASPPAYVDSLLEGVLDMESEKATIGHHYRTTKKEEDEAMGKMTDHMEEAIDDFLSDKINPKTCCEEIESVLHHGTQIRADSKLQHLWLHPSHHIALNAYITLATAYKIRLIDPETDTGKAFEMRRISAAYSLFLAGASHHLFSADPSLAVSASTFWLGAGESLLDLARLFPMESSGEPDVKCSKCLLLVNSNRDIKENCKQIMKCVTDISQVAWSFLTRSCLYLQKFRSPVDFSVTGSSGSGEREEMSEEQRVSIILLSFHCLLYADFLTDLCYGPKSHLASQFIM